MKVTPSPQDQEIIELLENLKVRDTDYPPDLLAARRVAFIEQLERYNQTEGLEALPSEQDQEVLQLLGELRSEDIEYPSKMLKSRRVAFIKQIKRHNRTVEKVVQPAQEEEIAQILQSFAPAKAGYPPELLAARRAAFVAQIANRRNRVSLLDAFRSTLRNIFTSKEDATLQPSRVLRTSLVVAGLLLAAVVGSFAYGSHEQASEPTDVTASQGGGPRPVPILATNTRVEAQTICKPGYSPPLCLAQEFDNSEDLTYQGNGARAAVAKDTLPGFGGVHRAAYANDGLYGPGSSWVSNSAYSWIKIDLGKAATINTVTFGRDRLGHYEDRSPGQFVIAVALADNIYADGNSSNDNLEYIQVYNSQSAGFSGTVSTAETVTANFQPTQARYVKITFANAGTAVDEVEAFMIQPPAILAGPPTGRDRELSQADQYIHAGTYKYASADPYIHAHTYEHASAHQYIYTGAYEYASAHQHIHAGTYEYASAHQHIYAGTYEHVSAN